MNRRQDAVYAAQIRRFHAELWHVWRARGVPDTALRESLVRLLDIGYVDSELAVMFGVSRERIRQWRIRFHLAKPDLAPHGPFLRVWDDTRQCFRAVRRVKRPRLAGFNHRALSAEARRLRMEEIRKRSLACLQQMIETSWAVPTRWEIAGELRIPISLLAAAWRDPVDRRHREAFRRFYAAAGVPDQGRHRARRRNALDGTVLEALQLAHARGVSLTRIAWRYGLSYGYVWRVVRGVAARVEVQAS